LSEVITEPKEKHFHLWQLLDDEGRSLVWLARRTDYSVNHIYHIKMGQRPASPEWRARVSEVLGISEQILFSCPEISKR